MTLSGRDYELAENIVAISEQIFSDSDLADEVYKEYGRKDGFPGMYEWIIGMAELHQAQAKKMGAKWGDTHEWRDSIEILADMLRENLPLSRPEEVELIKESIKRSAY